ncbi:MAG: methyl-accepting chemotaxis protein [Hyphomicrobium aestuarii]|nr:methyl-accepting chemotaxis protein [Hyphomicrobium aestuarii]
MPRWLPTSIKARSSTAMAITICALTIAIAIAAMAHYVKMVDDRTSVGARAETRSSVARERIVDLTRLAVQKAVAGTIDVRAAKAELDALDQRNTSQGSARADIASNQHSVADTIASARVLIDQIAVNKQIATTNATSFDATAASLSATLSRQAGAIGGFGRKADERQDAMHDSTSLMVISLLLFALGSVVGLTIYTVGYVWPHYQKILAGHRALAEGQSDFDIPGLDRDDEIGESARSLADFADKLRQTEALRAENQKVLAREESAKLEQQKLDQAHREAHAEFIGRFGEALQGLSNGDLKSRIEDPFHQEYEPLRHAFNRTVDKLQVAVFTVGNHVSEIGGATDRILTVADELLRHTEEQASSLEETSASMEEMAATVRQNAGNAREASVAAAATRERASMSGQVALRAITAMEKIEKSSRQVSEIVVLIEEIAFQTNILALNAAVEAARAGEAGNGFAVVANEVRALSQRASQALKDIKSLIESSNANVNEGAELVKHAGQSLTEISASVKRVADLIEEIASASQEQATGVDQVSRAVSNMDAMTQLNGTLVQETTSALQTSQSQIRELWDSIGNFDTGLTYFNKQAPGSALPPPRRWSIATAHEQHLPETQPRSVRSRLPKRKSSSAAAMAADSDWKQF